MTPVLATALSFAIQAALTAYIAWTAWRTHLAWKEVEEVKSLAAYKLDEAEQILQHALGASERRSREIFERNSRYPHPINWN